MGGKSRTNITYPLSLWFVSPNKFLYAAKDFLRAYKCVTKEYPRDRDLHHIKFYLLGHALELLLKGYLFGREMKRGKRGKEVREELKDFGHDLIKLLNKCEKYDFVYIPKENKKNIYLLHSLYKRKQLEYFEFTLKDKEKGELRKAGIRIFPVGTEFPELGELEKIIDSISQKVFPKSFHQFKLNP